METMITQKQFSELQGFMLHCWNVFHDNAPSEFDYWSKKLDELKISWHVQNTAAYLMNKRENGFLYFRNLLASKNIIIVKNEEMEK